MDGHELRRSPRRKTFRARVRRWSFERKNSKSAGAKASTNNTSVERGYSFRENGRIRTESRAKRSTVQLHKELPKEMESDEDDDLDALCESLLNIFEAQVEVEDDYDFEEESTLFAPSKLDESLDSWRSTRSTLHSIPEEEIID
mmetsp:Transcript_14814/g.29074  ORF Transcript_14814/g.29074 Transcript_14814/m.29074 type:complete len:144 (-) Transcript_14814:354-785(-)